MVYVYCSPEEKRTLERAAAQRASNVAGAKLPVHVYVLAAALDEARRELGALGRESGDAAD